MLNDDTPKRIQDLLDKLTAEGAERGVQMTVYRDGELFVDAWAGVADHRSGELVNGDTLFPVFSVTKGVTATIVHQAVEKGLLSYDMPIAEVWPEFAAHGKGHITLRQGLNHSAGIPHVPHRVDFEDFGNWDKMCAAVADLAPVFPAGSRVEYHAITYGWIVAEPVCRVTGKTFPQLLKEQIAEPIGEPGMYAGDLPEEALSRVAHLEEYELDPPPADPLAPSSVPGWIGPLHAFMNRRDMRQACLPASTGIMSARAIAKHYAALLPGGVDGVELLSQDRIRLALEPQGLLKESGEEGTWRLGYHGYKDQAPPGSERVAFGHAGYGGSLGFADPNRRIAVGITRNLLDGDESVKLLLQEIATW